MRLINLRNFDLNLLPILAALLEEKSVTAASRRVHLSQSATSSALRRIRECFNDPILIRRGQHMVASQKALLIHAELKDALEKLGGVLGTMRYNDRLGTDPDINIGAAEYVTTSLSPTLQRLLTKADRHFNINLQPFDRHVVLDRLDDGSFDIAIGAFGHLKPNIKRRRLYSETMIVAMRRDHPAARPNPGDAISLDDFVKYPHLHVTAGEILEDAIISRLLTSHSIVRRVTATLPNASLVPDVLVNTDLLCVGTRRGFEHLPHGREALVQFRMPEELQARHYDIEMIWHEQSEADDNANWVRAQLALAEAD